MVFHDITQHSFTYTLQVPTAAATAIKRIGPCAAPYCADVLGRCDPVARSAVVEALVRLGGAETADAVAKLLSHEDPGVRRHAADCLGRLGGDAAKQHAEALVGFGYVWGPALGNFY